MERLKKESDQASGKHADEIKKLQEELEKVRKESTIIAEQEHKKVDEAKRHAEEEINKEKKEISGKIDEELKKLDSDKKALEKELEKARHDLKEKTE